MDVWTFFWDDENDPEGNVEHIAEHDLTVEDVEHVLKNPTEEGTSKSTGFPATWGHTPDGRFIIVVYEAVAENTVRVINRLRGSRAETQEETVTWQPKSGNGWFERGN